jgi:hypothetical protein
LESYAEPIARPAPVVDPGLVVPARLRRARRAYRLPAVTFALFMVQGGTAAVGGVAGAFHPVNALLIFWASVAMARQDSAAGKAPS